MTVLKFCLQISHFEKVSESDPTGAVSVSPVTGEVINNRVLDFDDGSVGDGDGVISFSVLAAAPGIPGGGSGGGGDDGAPLPRVSEARVRMRLRDVNDNAPVFEQLVGSGYL